MKKFLSLILALALVMSLGTVAFADDVNIGTPIENVDSNNEAKAEVKVSTEVPADPGEVYYVTVTYSSLTFTYTAPTWGNWDGESMKYIGYSTDEEHGWDKESADITVTNQSNAAVDVVAAYSESQGIGGVTVSITEGSSLNLDSAAKGAELANIKDFTGTKQEGTVKVGVSGTPTEAVSDARVVGTVTITITADAG